MANISRILLAIVTHLLSFISLISLVGSDDVKEGLPFCGTSDPNSYIFVSTLDGRVTALDPNDGGKVLWSIHPGSEPMLSSSIHKLELTNYGHLVRMIPSLSGGLYRFNGEHIEAIPVTVENLLQSSFRYSDDLVISGGKESQTYGVNLKSGKILYECTMKGCGNESGSANSEDILIIQKLGQVVRAVEPRTGSERWNFSVAQHDIKLLSDCHPQNQVSLKYNLKVIIPEGRIYATDVQNPLEVLWEHKFASPVVSAWEINRGIVTDVDLFGGAKPGNMDLASTSPALYVGMHENQLYIQESVVIQNQRTEMASNFRQPLLANENQLPKIPWKPVSARGLLAGKSDGNEEVNQVESTALSVLYGSPYVEGSGYYLYSEEDMKKAEHGLCNATIHIEGSVDEHAPVLDEPGYSDDDTPVQIVIVSLWYWWREVFIISITTAIAFNIMFTRRFLSRRSVEPPDCLIASIFKESDSGVDVSFEKKRTDSESQILPEFTSRYLTDFDPVDCLGKGGFGVVFKAKNKIDDCEYAIKRIVLPNREESREKVMREVRSLAKLDHHHIVRYFNAWLECPPPGWQEEQDRSWIHSSHKFISPFSMSGESTVLTGQTSGIAHVNISVDQSPVEEPSESVLVNMNTNSSLGSECSDESNCDEMNLLKTDVSDSFIVFENSQEDEEKSCLVGEKSTVTLNDDTSSRRSCLKTSGGGKPSRPVTLDLSESSPLRLGPAKMYLYIQMQLCQQQSLKDWLTLNTNRDYKFTIKMFEQIVEAVEYVHLHGLIHRDLKPSNIFFSMDGQIKIGDFGLATTMSDAGGRMTPCDVVKTDLNKERHTAQVGTQLYMSPEQLSGKPYNYKVDIYSLGLILFELLVPFSTQMERLKVLQDTKQHVFCESFQQAFSNEFQLLKLMLAKSPEERPTTYGIRARPPLRQNSVESVEPATPEDSWHFDLPPRRRGSSKTSLSSSSGEGNSDIR